MGELTIAPVKRLIEKAGAKHVSKDAAKKLAEILEERAKEIIKCAADLANYAGRRTVMKKDIRLARKKLLNSTN
ncbi:MAG: NFYB/HAP3 family transcription factor subunit [Candidatus Aenigmarchaeota archaeon]|nr:NFYB/HAP3 family transcription factor subunit [Candidatus Aenigmarchaeota archaeon]OYT58058.1 MAG: histone [Candidatus Aenigmarchaeota archaeon ex4484_14]RLI97525.1 MAG: histone [Candidatus Aenigmarchaeota archaeon]